MLGSDTGRGAPEFAGSILRAHCPRELCVDARREHHVSAATTFVIRLHDRPARQVPADGARVLVAPRADGEGHPRRNRLGVPALHLLQAAAGTGRPTEVRYVLGPC